jgi:putative membrane protein insertion efficiency factor
MNDIKFYLTVIKHLFTKVYLTFCFGIDFIVMLWQKTRSLRSIFLFSNCRFYPSCSDYVRDAFKIHGLFHGFVLSVRRILRCNPLCEGGMDYVPNTTTSNEQLVMSGE